MKRLFFIAAIAGVALVSCTKNEVAPIAQQDEITFLPPVVGPQTKVYGEIGATYNTGESFDVWCVYNTGDITDWGGTAYFSDVKATYDGGLGGWALSPKYYWPATGQLSFVALSPSIDKTTSYDEDGFKITGWMQGNTEKTIVDLMYSDIAKNKAKADYNTDGDEKAGDANVYKGVDITFNHALSYIVFKVKTAADYSETTKFQLNKITLSGVYTAGDFDQSQLLDPWTEDTSGEKGTYIAFTSTEGLAFDSSAAEDAEAKEGEEIILLPQALAEGQQKITINYKISTDDGTTWIDQVQEVDIKNATVAAWEMGKKYTYTLSIGMQEILLDPAVTDWEGPVNGGISF